jgi:hypothetical protein
MAALEIYNKPDCEYRDESFSILCLNAWELLLKARILAINNNAARSIQVFEPRTDRNGAPTRKLYLKRNRAGNWDGRSWSWTAT